LENGVAINIVISKVKEELFVN